MAYQPNAAYRFVDGYSRRYLGSASRRGAPLSGTSTEMIKATNRDILVTGGTSRRSYSQKPRFGGGRLSPPGMRPTMASARATRMGGGRLSSVSHRGHYLGQLDVVGEGISAVESLVGGGPPDGSSKDPRIIDLNNAYNQAIAGQNGTGSGTSYINAWINDQPPHPTYSVTYARQLLQILAQAAASGQQAVPATSNTSPSAPPVVVPASGLFGAGSASIAGIPVWLIAVGIGAVLLSKK
jgi:hypothetical protein